jgi:Undecaprenyl-phosphate glucose phosphotransferase
MAAFSANDLRSLETIDDKSNDRINPHAEALRRVTSSLAAGAPYRTVPPAIVEGLARLGEVVVLIAVGLTTFPWTLLAGRHMATSALLTVAPVTFVAVFALQSLGCYRVAALRAPRVFALRILASWLVVMAASWFVLHWWCPKQAIGLIWLTHWFGVGLAVLAVERGLIAALVTYLSRAGRLSRRTVIVGGGPSAGELFEAFANQGTDDLQILGIFDDRTDERSPDVVGGFPKLGRVDDLVALGRKTPIDLIIFTLPITAERRLLEMLRKLWVLPVDIRLSAHTNKLRFRPRAYSYIGRVPVIDVFDKPLAEWDLVMKTMFDRMIGGLCLLLSAPLMLLIAVAVKLDSRGPILFRQTRYGFNNEPIEVLKFRSMYHDQLDFEARKLVTRNDPRVTRVGRFIRRSSLDELPQLFNVVFKGNLSLVGPRPHAINAHAADTLYDKVVDDYFARHKVRPGITGWAQINGWRGETDTPEKIQKRVECDLFYIENWSIFLDLYILFRTPWSLLTTHNAY